MTVTAAADLRALTSLNTTDLFFLSLSKLLLHLKGTTPTLGFNCFKDAKANQAFTFCCELKGIKCSVPWPVLQYPNGCFKVFFHFRAACGGTRRSVLFPHMGGIPNVSNGLRMNREEALQQTGRAGNKCAMFRNAAFALQFSLKKKKPAQKTEENWQGKED